MLWFRLNFWTNVKSQDQSKIFGLILSFGINRDKYRDSVWMLSIWKNVELLEGQIIG